MKKLPLFLLILPSLIGARVVVNQSDFILKSHLEAQVNSNETLVVKAFDADDEKGALLDIPLKQDSKLPLYKVSYDRMGTKDNWAGQWFGDDYMNRETVYQLFHKGKRIARLHPEHYTSAKQFRGKITQLLQRA
jgi:hypothetical protein